MGGIGSMIFTPVNQYRDLHHMGKAGLVGQETSRPDIDVAAVGRPLPSLDPLFIASVSGGPWENTIQTHLQFIITSST
jgi:hypothetical protein